MIRQRRLLAASVVLTAVVGCGQESVDRPSPEAPEAIKADGQTWNRVGSIEDHDQQLLKRHFSRNPALAENPIFVGELALYREKEGRRRFYWLSRLESDFAWLYIEFDGDGRFVQIREGIGEPFLPLAAETTH